MYLALLRAHKQNILVALSINTTDCCMGT